MQKKLTATVAVETLESFDEAELDARLMGLFNVKSINDLVFLDEEVEKFSFEFVSNVFVAEQESIECCEHSLEVGSFGDERWVRVSEFWGGYTYFITKR